MRKRRKNSPVGNCSPNHPAHCLFIVLTELFWMLDPSTSSLFQISGMQIWKDVELFLQNASFPWFLNVACLGHRCHRCLLPMFLFASGKKDTSFRYVVTVSKSGILDVLTDPPTSATVETFEVFLFAMCRARCNLWTLTSSRSEVGKSQRLTFSVGVV